MTTMISSHTPSTALCLQLKDLYLHQQNMRRRFYLACSFMCGDHAATLMAAIEANDLDTAQIIWEKHTGLTGP